MKPFGRLDNWLTGWGMLRDGVRLVLSFGASPPHWLRELEAETAPRRPVSRPHFDPPAQDVVKA